MIIFVTVSEYNHRDLDRTNNALQHKPTELINDLENLAYTLILRYRIKSLS